MPKINPYQTEVQTLNVGSALKVVGLAILALVITMISVRACAGGEQQAEGERIVEAKATRLYFLAMQGNYEQALAERVASEQAVNALQSYDRKYGKLESFTITRSIGNMVGTTGTAMIETVRNGKTIRETARWEAMGEGDIGPIAVIHIELELAEAFAPRNRPGSRTSTAEGSLPTGM
jgi:hypothetical protein